MTTALATPPSTRRLSEVARHVVIPTGVVTTGWPAVEKQCREFGDTFDEWQRGAGTLILGKRADGSYAATVGGITLSIPRQVAKTFLVGRIVFALCILFPGLKVLWTAHRTRTATNTFKHLQGYAKRKQVAPYVGEIRRTNGEQEIPFLNGSVIMFGARETGFGRGFDEVDVEVFDEAQILTERALDDMVPATNQSRHPHGALLIFMGTPPKPSDPGEAFTSRRAEALAGESEDAVYIECSADPGADPDDRKQWAVANPSYPHRTPERSMLRMRKNLVSVESWRREALGIWDEVTTSQPLWQAIDEDEWHARRHGGPIAKPTGWGIDTDVNAKGEMWSTIGCADLEAVDIVELREGQAWVVESLKQLRAAHPTARRVGLAGDGKAGELKKRLTDAGFEVVDFAARRGAQATGAMRTGIKDGSVRLVEGDNPFTRSLDRAAALATVRSLGDDTVTWHHETSDGDIGPVCAVTWAKAMAKARKGSGFML